MGGEGVVEVEASVEERDDAIAGADGELPSAAGAAGDRPLHFIGDHAFSRRFLLEELELPPLVHRRWDISG